MKLIIATPSPFARKARVVLLEKGLRFTVEVDNPWISGASIAAHNPLKKVPVLHTAIGTAASGRALTLR